MPDPKENLRLYLENAREMLEVAELNLGNDYYGSACNRAYYAVFYGASALLFAKGMAFGKHSAIISAFRQHFIKSGEFDVKWSGIYQRIMSHRQSGDYDININIEKEQAASDVSDAQEFIEEVQQWLRKQNLL
ncbi:MAG: HEPN domain-containing protein [Chloroflexota bacterium]